MGPIFLLLFVAAGWLLLVRPQQQRLRAQRDLVASLQVGDRVVTAGGIIGTITALDDRDAAVEVAPGIILTFLRPAVSRKLNDDEPGVDATETPIGTGALADDMNAGTSAADTPPTGQAAPANAAGPAANGTGAPAAGVPATGMPATGSPAAGAATGMPGTGTPGTGGPAASGAPAAGVPATGTPGTGSPAAGTPAAAAGDDETDKGAQ